MNNQMLALQFGFFLYLYKMFMIFTSQSRFIPTITCNTKYLGIQSGRPNSLQKDNNCQINDDNIFYYFVSFKAVLSVDIWFFFRFFSRSLQRVFAIQQSTSNIPRSYSLLMKCKEVFYLNFLQNTLIVHAWIRSGSIFAYTDCLFQCNLFGNVIWNRLILL